MQEHESLVSEFPEFKVSDITLAEFGRREIEIAEHEMPGLMAIRSKYASERPLQESESQGLAHDNTNRRSH